MMTKICKKNCWNSDVGKNFTGILRNKKKLKENSFVFHTPTKTDANFYQNLACQQKNPAKSTRISFVNKKSNKVLSELRTPTKKFNKVLSELRTPTKNSTKFYLNFARQQEKTKFYQKHILNLINQIIQHSPIFLHKI
jgi:hypothetical protein